MRRLLEGVRALDLTDERGFFCGKLLADFGVEVIKVEKPGGDAARLRGPYRGDTPGAEHGLTWLAYNAGKRAITLDIDSLEGAAIFREIVKSADIVIESFDPGYLASRGLDYAALSRIRPELVLVSITPFGQSGPYTGYAANDLVLMSLAGQVFLTGDSDRAPLRIGLPQACMHAGCDGAVGALLAYYYRRRTGRGQHVDIAMQHSAAWFLATTIPYWELAGSISGRVGTFRTVSSSGAVQRQVWQCEDGHVFFFMMGGQQGAKTGRELVRWMAEEGVRDEFLMTFEWASFDMATGTQEVIDRISAPIAAFFATRRKQAILEAAITRNISICPLFSMRDILNDASLAARGYWAAVEYPQLDASLPLPARYLRSSEADLWSASRAPRIGQDNAEIYARAGLAPARLEELRARGVI